MFFISIKPPPLDLRNSGKQNIISFTSTSTAARYTQAGSKPFKHLVGGGRQALVFLSFSVSR